MSAQYFQLMILFPFQDGGIKKKLRYLLVRRVSIGAIEGARDDLSAPCFSDVPVRHSVSRVTDDVDDGSLQPEFRSLATKQYHGDSASLNSAAKLKSAGFCVVPRRLPWPAWRDSCGRLAAPLCKGTHVVSGGPSFPQPHRCNGDSAKGNSAANLRSAGVLRYGDEYWDSFHE